MTEGDEGKVLEKKGKIVKKD